MRHVADPELDLVTTMLQDRLQAGWRGEEVLPEGMGLLFISDEDPLRVVIRDREPQSPPGVMRAFLGEEPDRQLLVRSIFADQREKEKFEREARQLPTDAPGLVMIAAGFVPGTELWIERLPALLHPGKHTRVGAVCVFSTYHHGGPEGLRWGAESRGVLNANARHLIPRWVREGLGIRPS